MRRWVAAAAIVGALVAWQTEAQAACRQHTYMINGQWTICTTCCFGGQCTTTCN